MLFSNGLIRTKIYGFFVALFVLSAMSFSLVIFLERESEDNYFWVNHTHEVLEMSTSLLVGLVDAETGQRGYLLTSNLEYLQPHYSGINESRILIAQLKYKTRDNPNQQRRLEQIKELVDQKFAELQETIVLNQSGERERALSIVKSNLGKRLMGEMRVLVSAFNQEETELLEERRSRFVNLNDKTQLMFIFEFIAFTFILLVLYGIVSKLILSPLGKLNHSAKMFQKDGKFIPVYIKNSNEIGLFAEAFNTMGQKVNSLLEDLDKTAKEAVKERDIAIEQAISDPLTGLSNRRFMEVELEKLIFSCVRYKHELSVIIFDIDFFKRINDTYGHPVGDVVLQRIGSILKQETRGGDLAIRYGGEEFMLVLPHTSLAGAEAKAEAIRQQVADTRFPELNNEIITVSLGITQLIESDLSISQLIYRADSALYDAKNSGRNKWKSL